jgi:hypothetical protein
MATTKQVTANRRNAQKSTGPKTPAGKAVVRLNAIQHGLLSREVLLPDEDEATLVECGKRLRAHLQPVGELELLLVDRIVIAAWRLRRLIQVEVGIFEWERYDTFNAQELGLGLAFIRTANHSDAFSKLSRYETTIERSLYRALHELQRLQAARAGQPVPPPAAVDVDVSVSTSIETGEP